VEITTNPARFDIDFIHRFLSEESTWAKNIPFETVKKSLQHSLCFAGFENGQQIAFARVVTDFATFAYLVDVFVVSEARGKGHCKTLLNAVLAHPELQGLRRFLLASSNARGVYEKFGFTPIGKPEIFMEINRPNVYRADANN
jgi:predicted GNAT family acetyltransferase